MATNMFYGASPEIFSRADWLRKNLTPTESILWNAINASKLDGFRFKSQHPLNNFIADFYCHKAKLVIELDGSVHDSQEQQDWDTNRTFMIEEFGIRVVRFRNHEVVKNLEDVLKQIRQYLPNP